MIEQKMRSALSLAAGLLLSAGAWGQTTTFTQTDDGNYSITVAEEYFGSEGGRVVTFDSGRAAAVKVNIAQVGGSGTLDENNERDILFTLHGATFDSSATINNLSYYSAAGTPSGDISRQLVSGGSRGDTSVTYRLKVENTITPGANSFLYFELPALMVNPVRLNPATEATPVMGAAVVVTFGQGGRAGSNPFPARILYNAGSGAPADPMRAVRMDLEGAVVKTAPALMNAELGTATPHRADVAVDNRKVIAANSGVPVPMAGGAMVRGLQLGTLTVALSPPGNPLNDQNSIQVLRTTGGFAPAVTANGLDSSLNGTVEISVSGNFQENDRVLLLPAASPPGEAAKTFERNAAGAMTVEVPLGTINPRMVVYVPGGVEDLTPGRRGTFRASLSLDFNDDRNKGGPVRDGISSGVIQFQGVMTRAYAHGVSRADDTEVTSLLRLTCASVTPPATGCNVFLSCNGEDGADYFGDLTGAEAIPSGGTGVYSSGQIASVLGGGWSQGAGRCDLLSNGTLEVQHMIRTSGLALHNNSVVIGATRTNSVGLLGGSGGGHPAGSVTISLGPAAPQGSLYLLRDGRFYGTLTAVTALQAQRAQARSMGLPPSTRLNAPPSSSGGGFQPMDHQMGCAYLEVDNTITPTNCIHSDDIDTTPALAGATELMNGDVVYPASENNAVFRPSSRRVVATSTGFVVSG